MLEIRNHLNNYLTYLFLIICMPHQRWLIQSGTLWYLKHCLDTS